MSILHTDGLRPTQNFLRAKDKMSISKITVGLVAVSLTVGNLCHAQQNTQQGAVIGGVTGAVIGGLIGKQSHKTTGGALIGGAVGAVAGGVVGNAQDKELARRDQAYQQAIYAQQQQIYYQQQVYQQQAQSGVTTGDIVSMTRSGVNDAVIMGQLQSRGVQRKLEVSDIISLHQQGVSDTVIAAMQAAPLAGQTVRPSYSQPVYVQQPVVVRQAPVIVHQPPMYYSSSPVIIEHHSGYHRHGYRF